MRLPLLNPTPEEAEDVDQMVRIVPHIEQQLVGEHGDGLLRLHRSRVHQIDVEDARHHRPDELLVRPDRRPL
jgi:hypothetical protein